MFRRIAMFRSSYVPSYGSYALSYILHQPSYISHLITPVLFHNTPSLSLVHRLLIARPPLAYRSSTVCLSLVRRLLIARPPSAYRSSTACLSLVHRLLITRSPSSIFHHPSSLFQRFFVLLIAFLCFSQRERPFLFT